MGKLGSQDWRDSQSGNSKKKNQSRRDNAGEDLKGTFDREWRTINRDAHLLTRGEEGKTFFSHPFFWEGEEDGGWPLNRVLASRIHTHKFK
jgi:hypothetical protein